MNSNMREVQSIQLTGKNTNQIQKDKHSKVLWEVSLIQHYMKNVEIHYIEM